jgi:hypothetical protein
LPVCQLNPDISGSGKIALYVNVMHKMNIDFHFIILAVLWLGGGNLIILLSLKRQKLSLKHMLTPNVMKKLQGQDWLKILALLIGTLAIAILLA